MRSTSKRLSESILRKKILKELNFLLKEDRVANLANYLQAANMVFAWANSQGAYKISPEKYYNKTSDEFTEEEYKDAQQAIKSQIASDPHNSDASENFLTNRDVLQSAPYPVVNSSIIIIDDSNREYWKYVDGSPRWAKSNYTGMAQTYPKGGLWQVARSIASENASSRRAIQNQVGNQSVIGVTESWIQKNLSFFTYLSEDVQKCIDLWNSGHHKEAIISFLDIISIADVTGASDIIGGILLIASGESLAGTLTLLMGAANAALFIADIVSMGATSPIHSEFQLWKVAWHGGTLGLKPETVRFVEKIAYGSELKISALKASNKPSLINTANVLQEVSLRSQKVLERGGPLTTKDVEYILGSDISNIGKIKIKDPVAKADRDLISQQIIPHPAGAVIQAPFAAMTFDNYYGLEGWDITKKRALLNSSAEIYSKICKDIKYKNMCNKVTYDKNSGSIKPIQQGGENDATARILKMKLVDDINKSGIIQKLKI